MKGLFVAIFLMLLPSMADAQTYLWVESQVAVEKVGTELDRGEQFTTFSYGHQWNPWLGLFFTSSIGNTWGETALGPSFALTKELQVGAGIGMEHKAPHTMRLRLNAYYDHEATGSFVYVQVDAERHSYWYWIDAARMVGPVGLGLLVQMPDGGAGPKLEVRLGEHFGLWAAPVWDWQTGRIRTLLGGRIMFESGQ